jgi:3-oxoacyl-[acyl-carrier protein] reductase
MTSPDNSSLLHNRVAVVTGSSRGIGRAIALALAGAGASVAVNFLQASTGAEDVKSRAVAIGQRAVAIQADVSVRQEAQRLVASAEGMLGPVDILVNNAGIARPQQIEDIAESDWDCLIDVNLKSAFLMSQAVLPGMRSRKWGRIVNISSVAAQTGGVVGAHDAASKAGMLGLTRYCARYFAAEGITVNALAPALIETDMSAANPNAQAAHIPAGRLGTVEEVAQAVVLLTTNGYINGQTINLNGGWFMT